MRYSVTLSPYCSVSGTIDVPDDIPEEEIENYINDNIDSVTIEEDTIEMDTCGTEVISFEPIEED